MFSKGYGKFIAHMFKYLLDKEKLLVESEPWKSGKIITWQFDKLYEAPFYSYLKK